MCDEHLIELVTGEKVDLHKHGLHPAEIKIGRTLTLERVLQMNSRTYFYSMLKDNPELTAIYPGIEDDLLRGAIDCHIHADPDFVHRSQDMIDISISAARARMRAVYFKDHWNLTASAAYLVQRYVDELVADGRLEASSGGLRRTRSQSRHQPGGGENRAPVPQLQDPLVSNL